MSPPISARMTDGGQQQDGYAKRLDLHIDLPIDRAVGDVESFDMVQVQLQQEAVVIGHPAVQRFAQHRWRRLDTAMGEKGQSIGINLAGDQSFDQSTAGKPDDVRDRLMLTSSSVFCSR